MGAVRSAGKAAAALLLLLLVILAGFRLAAALREDGAPPPAGTLMVATPYGRVAVGLSGPPDGPPVMLIHGTAAWRGFWKDVAGHLAGRGWRVIAIDLPPFGWSGHDPEERYDRVTQAERLASVLAAVAGRPAVVVGHSFGGGPATELALRHPRRLRLLVLVDAALGELDGPAKSGGALRFRPLADAAKRHDPGLCGVAPQPVRDRRRRAEPPERRPQAPRRPGRADLGGGGQRHSCRSGKADRGTRQGAVLRGSEGTRAHTAYRGCGRLPRRAR